MKASAKIFAALCCALAAATSWGAQIVENGACDIAVVLPRNAGEADARAANVLARELAKLARSGLVKVSFQDGTNARAKTRIFLKKSGEPFNIRGGNSIRVKSGSESVEICYPDGSRAINAAGLFLRKLCSMRFYAPGELGTHFERRENFEIPEGEFVYKDAFAGAGFYAAVRNPRDGEKVREWLGLNGAHSVGGGFSHNMKNIFDADFLRAHPEISARRRDGSPKPRSQPDLLNPLAAGQAAKKAGEFFAEKPFAKSSPWESATTRNLTSARRPSRASADISGGSPTTRKPFSNFPQRPRGLSQKNTRANSSGASRIWHARNRRRSSFRKISSRISRPTGRTISTPNTRPKISRRWTNGGRQPGISGYTTTPTARPTPCRAKSAGKSHAESRARTAREPVSTTPN